MAAYPQHRQPGTLTPGEAVTAWEPLPLEKFHLPYFHAAISAVIPEAPCDAPALEELINGGKVRVAGVLWPDRLRFVVAWLECVEQPPQSALERGYRMAVADLANIPKRLHLLNFGEDTQPRGTA